MRLWGYRRQREPRAEEVMEVFALANPIWIGPKDDLSLSIDGWADEKGEIAEIEVSGVLVRRLRRK